MHSPDSRASPLLLHTVPPDEMMMQQQMAGQQGPKPDMNQVFKAERESIELLEYQYALEDVESTLLNSKA